MICGFIGECSLDNYESLDSVLEFHISKTGDRNVEFVFRDCSSENAPLAFERNPEADGNLYLVSYQHMGPQLE